MDIIFKKINDLPETYYGLDLDEAFSYGQYLIDNGDNQLMGKALKLHKFLYFDNYGPINNQGELYVSLSIFSSEFYPVNLGKDVQNKVGDLISEAINARIDKQYESPMHNDIINAFADITASYSSQDNITCVPEETNNI